MQTNNKTFLELIYELADYLKVSYKPKFKPDVTKKQVAEVNEWYMSPLSPLAYNQVFENAKANPVFYKGLIEKFICTYHEKR